VDKYFKTYLAALKAEKLVQECTICMAKRNLNWALTQRFQLQVATFMGYVVQMPFG